MFFFVKNVSRPSNPPSELAQNVSKKKKNLSDELLLHFFFESSEFDRVFNYSHDSNSIFGPENYFRRVFRPHSTLSRPPKRGRSVVVSKRNFATLLSTTTQSSNRLRKVPTRSRPTCSLTKISSLSPRTFPLRGSLVRRAQCSSTKVTLCIKASFVWIWLAVILAEYTSTGNISSLFLLFGGRDFVNLSLVSVIRRWSPSREVSTELFLGCWEEREGNVFHAKSGCGRTRG